MVRALWDVGTEQEGQGGGEQKGSLPGNHLHNAALHTMPSLEGLPQAWDGGQAGVVGGPVSC